MARKVRVLLADNDLHASGGMLSRALHQLGIEHEIAQNPTAVDAYLQQEGFDVLVVTHIFAGGTAKFICGLRGAGHKIPPIVVVMRQFDTGIAEGFCALDIPVVIDLRIAEEDKSTLQDAISDALSQADPIAEKR